MRYQLGPPRQEVRLYWSNASALSRKRAYRAVLLEARKSDQAAVDGFNTKGIRTIELRAAKLGMAEYKVVSQLILLSP